MTPQEKARAARQEHREAQAEEATKAMEAQLRGERTQ
jgi:hypothetical protein